MYIGLAADPTWIQEVFGVQTAAQIDIDKTRLLDRETPASQRVRTVIGMWNYNAKIHTKYQVSDRKSNFCQKCEQFL